MPLPDQRNWLGSRRSRTRRRTPAAVPARRAANAWRPLPSARQSVRARRSPRFDPTRPPASLPPPSPGATRRRRSRRTVHRPSQAWPATRFRRAALSPSPGRSDAPGAVHRAVADSRGPPVWEQPRGLSIQPDTVPLARRSFAGAFPSRKTTASHRCARHLPPVASSMRPCARRSCASSCVRSASST